MARFPYKTLKPDEMTIRRKIGSAEIEVTGTWEQCQQALDRFEEQSKAAGSQVQSLNLIRETAKERGLPNWETRPLLDLLRVLLGPGT